MNDYEPWTFEESLSFTRELQGLFKPKVSNIWARKGSTDAKHVEAWKTPKGQKVDLFFLR